MSTGRSPSRLALHLLSHLRESSRNSEAGLSLIECLVAIIIITLTVVAITPPIMLATATRVQTRRADQANQVAQGEIDRVRTLVERGKYTVADLPEPVANIDAAVATSATNVVLSSAVCAPGNYPGLVPTPAAQVVPVDINGDCQTDYWMQVFRTDSNPPPGETVPFSFQMGVRVYSAYEGETAPPTLDKVRSSLVSGTNSRDRVNGGGAERRPLAVLISTINRGGSDKSLCSIRESLGGVACPGATPSPTP